MKSVYIFQEKYVPGDRIPNEFELAEKEMMDHLAYGKRQIGGTVQI